MSSSSRDPDYLGEADEELRQFLAGLISPCDACQLSDEQIEFMLKALGDSSLSNEQIEMIMRKVELKIQAARRDSEITSSLVVPLPSSKSPTSLPSSIPGFAVNLTSLGGFTHALWTLLALVSGIILTLAFVLLAIRGIRVHVDVPESELAKQSSDTIDMSRPESTAPTSSSVPVVAHLGKLAKCRWTDSHVVLVPGEPLRAGQVIRISDGVVEIRFEVGARVVVQAPAVVALEAAKSIHLERGKLSAEITARAARGFQICTPDGIFVDQGTEFGVEVSPDGNSRVHVFKGAVDVKQTFPDQPSVPHRLLARGEAWLEKGSQSMELREAPGDSFIRSVDEADRDRHVVAYWRFEDLPLGGDVPHTMQNRRSVRATVDSSFNGNDLFAYTDLSHPSFSRDVPAPVVTRSGQPNLSCLDNSQRPPGQTRNLYTHSAFSHAAPLDLQSIVPRHWTIEASIRPANVHGGVQTFLGRDGNAPHAAVVVPSRLAFQINASGRFAIRFIDTRQRTHEAIADALDLNVGAWYHLAATSDGQSLKLYVDTRDGRGYVLCAETQLPDDDGTALSRGSRRAEWSLGRGKVKNHVSENFRGWIDEVRISDIAREPEDFLFAKGREE